MSHLPGLDVLESAATLVYRTVAPTPQYAWPLLSEALGTTVWVKHENHAPTGAFKARGAMVHLDRLRREQPQCRGVVAATRGNFGQAIGFAARHFGFSATLCVPLGNSPEKNAAMRSLGVELVEHGHDFQAAREHATALAEQRGLPFLDSFHGDLVLGVASYWLEFMRAVPTLEVVYVPIGQGSGICGAIAARAALGRRLRIVGVVSSHATAYLQSFHARRAIEAPVSTRLADGLACRVPHPAALATILAGADDVVAVSDPAIAAAMRLMFRATHNTAEGAGAAALAAAWNDRATLSGRTVGVTLTGSNVDTDVFAGVLAGTFNGTEEGGA